MQNKTLFIILGAIGGVLVLCACTGIGAFFLVVPRIRDAAARQQSANDLKQVGLAAHSFYSAHKRMPANVDDLAPLLENGPVVNRIRKGEIVVVWSTPPFDRGDRSAVYAWDTQVFAGDVRNVAYADASVEALPKAEFDAKTKSKTK